jgi:hypothetical protein
MATSAPSYILPDDVLSAVLELARREIGKDRLAFPGHDEDLQRIFSELSQDSKYDLLRQFVFSSAGPRRYSPALSDSVSKLQLAGLLGRQNPDYEILFTTPSAIRFYDEVLSRKFSKGQIGQLREVAVKFLSQISPI